MKDLISNNDNLLETDFDCIIREFKEEAGIDFAETNFTPIIRLLSYHKDFSTKGTNTKVL